MKIQLPLCPSFTDIIGTPSALKSNLKITPVLSTMPEVKKCGICNSARGADTKI